MEREFEVQAERIEETRGEKSLKMLNLLIRRLQGAPPKHRLLLSLLVAHYS